MVAYLGMSRELDGSSLDRAAEKQVSNLGIAAALGKALDENMHRRTKCEQYSSSYLLLVDVLDSVDA